MYINYHGYQRDIQIKEQILSFEPLKNMFCHLFCSIYESACIILLYNLVKKEYIFRENNTNVVSYFIYSNLKYYISHVLSLQLYTFICGDCQQ